MEANIARDTMVLDSSGVPSLGDVLYDLVERAFKFGKRVKEYSRKELLDILISWVSTWEEKEIYNHVESLPLFDLQVFFCQVFIFGKTPYLSGENLAYHD